MSVFFIHPMRPGCALFFEAVATPGISPRTYHLVMFQCPGLLWLFAFVTHSWNFSPAAATAVSNHSFLCQSIGALFFVFT